MVTRVVCLGGGYSSVNLARGLKQPIKSGVLELTVVSRDNFHTFHGFVHEMLAGKVQPGQIISPSRRIFPPARFHNSEIEAIDLDRRTVTCSRLLDSQHYELEYDHLVLALGSVDDLSRYAGIAEHAQRLKTYADCFRARNHLLSMLELAEIEQDPEERRRLLTFVIVGGNFGGVEIATEVHDHVHRLVRREYSHIPADEIRTVLVHPGEHLLPELHRNPRLVQRAEAEIARMGIETRLKTRVAAATAEEAILNDGTRISTRTIISCAGTAQSPLLDGLDLPRDQRGRVITDEFLEVKDRPGIWAAGDCAAVPHPKGGLCPALGIFALTEGRQIAENIKRKVSGKPLKKFTFTGLGEACSLGPHKAVAQMYGFEFTGFIAWIAWRFMLLYFVPTRDRKVRLAIDWMMAPLLGRDIVNMKMDPQFGIRRELFEVGQEIVSQGDVGRRMYLIWSGEVEVCRMGREGIEVLATLGPGQHFGEISVFQDIRRTATVRARTRVELVSIGQQDALVLSSATDAFGTLKSLPQSGATPGK